MAVANLVLEKQEFGPHRARLQNKQKGGCGK